MKRAPRPPQESLFSHGMWQHMIWVGLLIGGVCLSTQAWAMHSGSEHWQTMVFTVLTLSQLGHVVAIRAETESVFSIGFFSNHWMTASVIITFLFQMAVIYLPSLNEIFKATPLTLSECCVHWPVNHRVLCSRS
jgi:Ca2+-transporting ATPase